MSNYSLQEGSLPVTIGTSRYQYGWGYQTILDQSKLQCQQVSFKGMYRVTLGDLEVAGSQHGTNFINKNPPVTHGSWTSINGVFIWFNPQKHPGPQDFSSTPCYQLQQHCTNLLGRPTELPPLGRLVGYHPQIGGQFSWTDQEKGIVLRISQNHPRNIQVMDTRGIPPILGTPLINQRGETCCAVLSNPSLGEKDRKW